MKALHQANATLIGGHTTEGEELVFGLACNGFADPQQLWRKSGMQPGQTLILTKALGTGTLFAADMRLKARGHWIDSAIQSMLLSNQAATPILRQHGATACTDVTGFGLLGHLLELARASQITMHLNLDALPILNGAVTTTQQGILSSLHPQNLQTAHTIPTPEHIRRHPHFPLLFDPQTSGGLLAAVPAIHTSDCLTELHAAGYADAVAIGHTCDNSQPLVTYSPCH
jgi:selenide,water dikinase